MSLNYVGGEWLAGSNAIPNVNPSNTCDVVGEYAQASATDVARHRTPFEAGPMQASRPGTIA